MLTVRGLPERFFLAWVETYISKFGGDPNKVTLSVFYAPPRHQFLISIAHTIQLGPERRSYLYYRPPRYNPRQPSIQGCRPRGSLQSQNQLRLTPFNSSNQATHFPSTRPTTRDTKPPTTSWCSPPDALQLLTLWNASVLLHMPPSRTLSTPTD